MTHVTIPETVLFTQLGDEAVLVNQATGVYVGLDRVGTVMWQTLAQYPEIAQALQVLLSHFDVAPEQCAADLERFIQELVGQRLLAEVA
jgi:hypothetical protein